MWLGTIAGALGQARPALAAPVAALAALPLGYLTWLADRRRRCRSPRSRCRRPAPLGVVAIYGLAASLPCWPGARLKRDRPPARARGAARSPRSPPRAALVLLASAARRRRAT